MTKFSIAPEQASILEAYRSMNRPIVEKKKKKDCGCKTKKSMLSSTDKEGKGHKRMYGKNVSASYSTDESTSVNTNSPEDAYKRGKFSALNALRNEFLAYDTSEMATILMSEVLKIIDKEKEIEKTKQKGYL